MQKWLFSSFPSKRIGELSCSSEVRSSTAWRPWWLNSTSASPLCLSKERDRWCVRWQKITSHGDEYLTLAQRQSYRRPVALNGIKSLQYQERHPEVVTWCSCGILPHNLRGVLWPAISLPHKAQLSQGKQALPTHRKASFQIAELWEEQRNLRINHSWPLRLIWFSYSQPYWWLLFFYE